MYTEKDKKVTAESLTAQTLQVSLEKMFGENQRGGLDMGKKKQILSTSEERSKSVGERISEMKSRIEKNKQIGIKKK